MNSLQQQARFDAFVREFNATAARTRRRSPRGRERQSVPILDLPLPSPRPEGVEWIEAYRH